MRVFSQVVFDAWVDGTAYTPPELDQLLSQADKLAIHAVADRVGGAGVTLLVAVEHSGDGRNFVQKYGTAEIDRLAIAQGQTNSLVGTDDGSRPSLEFARLAIQVAGGGGAHVRVMVTGKTDGFPPSAMPAGMAGVAKKPCCDGCASGSNRRGTDVKNPADFGGIVLPTGDDRGGLPSGTTHYLKPIKKYEGGGGGESDTGSNPDDGGGAPGGGSTDGSQGQPVEVIVHGEPRNPKPKTSPGKSKEQDASPPKKKGPGSGGRAGGTGSTGSNPPSKDQVGEDYFKWCPFTDLPKMCMLCHYDANGVLHCFMPQNQAQWQDKCWTGGQPGEGTFLCVSDNPNCWSTGKEGWGTFECIPGTSLSADWVQNWVDKILKCTSSWAPCIDQCDKDHFACIANFNPPSVCDAQRGSCKADCTQKHCVPWS